MTSARSFEELIAEAEAQPFSGWDFSFLRGRMVSGQTTWSYEDLVRGRLPGVQAVLDLGTGGGELLASLAPLPPRTVATEAYPPNVPIARRRLQPLGVEVVAVEGAPDNAHMGPGEGIGSLPFEAAAFPLIIDRHESYFAAELFRILQPGGSFMTQQVGGTHDVELSRLLGGETTYDARWNLGFAVHQLEMEGFTVVDAREEFPETFFADIGATAYYVKAVPWQVPDFTIGGYWDRLRALDERMRRDDGLRVQGHFFYLEAMRPT